MSRPRRLGAILSAPAFAALVFSPLASLAYDCREGQCKCPHTTANENRVLEGLLHTMPDPESRYPRDCKYAGSRPKNYAWRSWKGIGAQTYWFIDHNTWYIYRTILDRKTQAEKEAKEVFGPGSGWRRYYPPANYCDCKKAAAAARKLGQEYRGSDVEAVREMNRMVDAIKTTQVYEVCIKSQHNSSLKGRIIWKGSLWGQWAEADASPAKNLAKYMEDYLKKFIGAFSGFRKLMQSYRDIEEAVIPPKGLDRWMLASDAVKQLEALDRETKRAVKLAEEVRDRLYCTYGLPRDLSTIAVIDTIRRKCVKPGMASMGTLQDLSDTFAGMKAGDIDILAAKEPIKQVAAAIRKCEKLGISVKPHPLDPRPKDNCNRE